LCRVPLQRVRPAHNRLRFVRESLDRQTREVANVGDGAYEIVAQIRYENYADQVLALIKAGVDGYALTFYPDFDNYPAVSNVCEMVEPTEIPELPFEKDAPSILEWAIEIRLRRMDGSAFQGVFEAE
ncbi:unnamed protein product, partial [marine sediment metagenome]